MMKNTAQKHLRGVLEHFTVKLDQLGQSSIMRQIKELRREHCDST